MTTTAAETPETGHEHRAEPLASTAGELPDDAPREHHGAEFLGMDDEGMAIYRLPFAW